MKIDKSALDKAFNGQVNQKELLAQAFPSFKDLLDQIFPKTNVREALSMKVDVREALSFKKI